MRYRQIVQLFPNPILPAAFRCDIMKHLKALALRLLLVPGAEALFAPFARGRAVVFMLHRFRSPEHPFDGYDPTVVRRALSHLRRERYRILSIEELLRCASEERVPDRAVAFTIDDGYFDHATVAAPLFAEFDCPVTTFVTTGFLDGQLWFWWDRIEYVFARTKRQSLRVALADMSLEYQWTTPAERIRAQLQFTEACKRVRDEDKHAAIRLLAEVADVQLPERAPREYAPMTWDELRTCERSGMTFGPHTVTHPVLSRVSDQQSRWELEESWRRLRQESTAPSPVFCYPNGQKDDYSQREIATLRHLGLIGAVVGAEGFVSAQATRQNAHASFTARRYPFPDDLPRLVQYVSGLESAKSLLRGQRA